MILTPKGPSTLKEWHIVAFLYLWVE